MKNTKDAIKKVRNKLMLNQKEFADFMSVGPGTVSRWERGVQRPKPVHIRRMDQLTRAAWMASGFTSEKD